MSNIVPVAESTKWYFPDGRPCVEVPSADGKKMVDPTVLHARKLGLLPSVTSILKILDKPMVTQWKIEQALLMSLQSPISVNEEPSAYVSRICQSVNDVTSVTADRGKELHAGIELGLLGLQEPRDPAAFTALGHIRARIKSHSADGNMVVTPEGTFANSRLGFAGRWDIRLHNATRRVYMDIKTTDLAKFNKPYPEWGLQLCGGYGLGDDAPDGTVYEQVVVDRNSGETKFFVWGTKDTGSFTIAGLQDAFLSIRSTWGHLHNWRPWEK